MIRFVDPSTARSVARQPAATCSPGELLIPAEYNESLRRVDVARVVDVTSPNTATAAVTTAVATSATTAIAASATTDIATAAVTAAPPTPGDWMDEELKEWRKATVPTLRSFATTMLTTSTGGVAVYFAVLKYLGWEKAQFSTALVALTIAPPVLLFAAAVAFALALHPSLEIVEKRPRSPKRRLKANALVACCRAADSRTSSASSSNAPCSARRQCTGEPPPAKLAASKRSAGPKSPSHSVAPGSQARTPAPKRRARS